MAIPDFENVDPKKLRQAVEYDTAAVRHSEQLNEARENTKRAVIASTLAFLAAVLFGVVDFLGDRRWSAEQTEVLKSIERTLVEANKLYTIETTQNEINKRIESIGYEIKLLKK